MNIIHLDNRGLKPPQPLIRILTACDALGLGERIEALMDRRPIFLFPELDERNLKYTCNERAEGGYTVTIERND